MNTTNTIRAIVAALVLSCGLLHSPADAQFVIGGGMNSNPVLSSKDFDAILDSVGFDDGQRQLAGSMFDDAQVPMFAAKRQFDDVVDRTGTDTGDQKVREAQQQARRALAQAMSESIDRFFQSLSAVARPEQQADVERERLAARRRAIRALVGEAIGDGAAQYDLERTVAGANLAPTERAAALKALTTYREQLDALMPKLVDAVPAAQQQDTGFTVIQDEDGKPRIERAGGDRNDVSARSMRELLAQLSGTHRNALLLLDQALPAEQAWKLRVKALQRIWPRSGMDPDSPSQVFEQLISRTTDPAARTAIENARTAWAQRWWNISLRMTVPEDDMRGTMFGFAGVVQEDPGSKKALEEYRKLAAERRTIDRDTWYALAALDPAHREFHEQQAKDADNKTGNRFVPRRLPKEGEKAGETNAVQIASAVQGISINAGDGGAPDGPVNITTAATMVVSANVVGDGNAMVFTSNADEGGNGITFAMGDGELPAIFGDAMGDGMGGQINFHTEEISDATMSAAGLCFAREATAERIRALAATLGVAADNPALAALMDDYAANARVIGAEHDTRLQSAVSGSAFEMGTETKVAPIEEVRAGVKVVEDHASALAAIDDELIDRIAALSGAEETVRSAVRADRARERIRGIGYPGAPVSVWATTKTIEAVDLPAVARAAGLQGAAQNAATQAWIAWSPGALASAERRRADIRATCIEEIELMRKQFSAASGPQPANDATGIVSIDGEQAKRMSELFQMRATRTKEILEQAIAGRDAVEAVLADDMRAAFHDAWLRAAAPSAYNDAKDAMPTLDAARALADTTDAQRTQIDAIRGAHAARHRELCNRLAKLLVLEQMTGGALFDAGPTGPKKEAGMSMTDTRFERSELNARSLRRLKAMLTPEQVRAIPALARTAAKEPVPMVMPFPGGKVMGATVSPAPTPAAPAPKSP
jgi:hypothetical protein